MKTFKILPKHISAQWEMASQEKLPGVDQQALWPVL